MDSPETSDTESTADTYLAMWDSQGLEYIFNVTQYQQQAVIHALKHSEHLQPPVSMNALLLRARYNTHRHYEIYTFSSLVSEEEIRQCFKDSPQAIVDQIRKIGEMIYSDRLIEESRVIK